MGDLKEKSSFVRAVRRLCAVIVNLGPVFPIGKTPLPPLVLWHSGGKANERESHHCHQRYPQGQRSIYRRNVRSGIGVWLRFIFFGTFGKSCFRFRGWRNCWRGRGRGLLGTRRGSRVETRDWRGEPKRSRASSLDPDPDSKTLDQSSHHSSLVLLARVAGPTFAVSRTIA